MDERERAAAWLNEPEHDIGFDEHKHDYCGAGKGCIDPTCERCAVEIALAAYAHERVQEALKEANENDQRGDAERRAE